MQKKHSDRLERVREVVDEIIRQQPDLEQARCGFVHLYGVALLCVQLAHKRGLDAQLCGIAGMLHDISSYKASPSSDHPLLSAQEADRILGELRAFTCEETDAITIAIAQHGDKERTDGPMAELLKDADVAQQYLYNPALKPERRQHPRLRRVFGELGLSEDRPTVEVTLRQATAADSEFAYQVKKTAFREYAEKVWGWNEAEQHQLHERRFAAQEFHIIQVSGTDIGILAIVRAPDCVKVNQLFILPEHQGKGIGKACMLQVIHDADAAGLPVRLQVLKVNTRADAFFRKMGFRDAGQTNTHVLMKGL